METLPDEILNVIFKHFDLRCRLLCCTVCKKWSHLLTSGGGAKMDLVAVLNIFEKSVWNSNIATSAKSRLKSVEIDDLRKLGVVADHVGSCNSLKIWFRSADFVQRTLKILSQTNMQMRCLDMYPYGDCLPLNAVQENYPDAEALVLRPHGPDYFWTGMPFNEFPQLRKLDSLVLDSLTINAHAQLPVNLTQLEWAHRDDQAFPNFLNQMSTCENLKYLLLSHVHLDEHILTRLLDILTLLRHLTAVVFKFIKFASIQFPSTIAVDVQPPPLKVLKFDLCYGDLYHTVLQFLSYAPSQLQLVQINSIYEENQMNCIYRLVPSLSKRNLWLQLGVLQRQTRRETSLGPNRPLDNNVLPQALPDHPPEANLENEGEHEVAADLHLVAYPPLDLRDILCRVELSFVEDDQFLNHLFSCGSYAKLLEARFIQCAALTDNVLEIVAKSCPRLKKVYMNGCDNVSKIGLIYFVSNWNQRKSKELNIVWRSDLNFDDFAVDLAEKCGNALKVKCFSKCLPNNLQAERIMIWDANGKLLVIQNYSSSELHWIMGFVLDSM